jgi:cytochrome c-type biogenesis protein
LGFRNPDAGRHTPEQNNRDFFHTQRQSEMINDISIYMAFAAGLVSFLSPCVLPLVPGYVSFISGVSLPELKADTGTSVFLNREHRIVVLNAIFFIFGFSAVFILLGASATWIGALLTAKLNFFTKLAGLIIIFFGILKMGLIRPLPFLKEFKIPIKTSKAGLVGAVMLGANQGVRLLLVYSLGLGLPFFLTALGVQHFFRFFNRIKNHLGLIEKISGLVLVVMGVLILTNSLTLIQAYFPFLNQFAL